MPKRVLVEFFPKNTCLNEIIVRHHLSDLYPPHNNHRQRFGWIGEELYNQLKGRYPEEIRRADKVPVEVAKGGRSAPTSPVKTGR